MMLRLSSVPSLKLGLRIVLLAVLLILAVTAVSTYLVSHPDEEVKRLGYKTVELTIQVLLVVIVGGIIVQEYIRGQARRAALNESRKVMLRQLIQAYSRTKKARRLLRARCVRMAGDDAGRNERAIDYAAYNDQLGSINETQLDLEIVARELKVIQSGFANSEVLRSHVKAMEKYLNELVDEYESTLGECDPKQSIPLSQLPRMRAFIAKGKDESFSPYSTAFHSALDLIQQEKLKF